MERVYMKRVYVISCGMGFISKIGKDYGIFSGIRFTDDLQKAKRFYSEKEAQDFVNKYDPKYYHIKDVTPYYEKI